MDDMKQLRKKLARRLVKGVNEFGEKFQAVQLLPEVAEFLPEPEAQIAKSFRFYQTQQDCFIEYIILTIHDVEEPKEVNMYKIREPHEFKIELPRGKYTYNTTRMSLEFITDQDGPIFTPDNPILENVITFLETQRKGSSKLQFDYNIMHLKQ